MHFYISVFTINSTTRILMNMNENGEEKIDCANLKSLRNREKRLILSSHVIVVYLSTENALSPSKFGWQDGRANSVWFE